MLRLRCPNCTKVLSVPDTLAGKAGICPHCKSKVRVPAQDSIVSDVEVLDELEEIPPSPSERVQSTPPSKARARRPRRDEEEVEDVEWEEVSSPRRGRADPDEDDRPARRRGPRDEDEDEPRERRPRYDEDEPPRRRRRKRRARSGGESSMSGLLIGGLVAGGLCLVMAGLSLVFPPMAIVLVFLGYVVAFVGGIMFLIVAFRDDAMQGALCLIVPFYSLFYLVTHWEEAKGPFLIQVAGFLITMLGGCAGGMGASMRNQPLPQNSFPPTMIHQPAHRVWAQPQ